jgi:hypothetical protein
MPKVISLVPRMAIFLAGVAAGALTLPRRDRPSGAQSGAGPDESAEAVRELKNAVAGLENRLAAQEAASANRFTQIEARLDEHASKLADMPSTTQIVSAMEQLLAKTMSSLDERLTTQAHSIDVLKHTVSQTDSLLERVLESLDSLQSYADTSEVNEDVLLHRPAV